MIRVWAWRTINCSICGQAYQQSAAVALNLAQTAGLCRDYELRENAIKLLATRGDAKAQRILGNLYFFGAKTICKQILLPRFGQIRTKQKAWLGMAVPVPRATYLPTR